MSNHDTTAEKQFAPSSSDANGTTNNNGVYAPAAPLSEHMQQPPRHSRGSGGSYVRDITKEFITASKQLQSGELVKDEFFTLFEAVGALEIMDAKMDTGYVPPGDSLEPDFDVCAGLKAEHVVWIMDELFRLEMSLHDGYPLSQTIFTSLHVFRLISPENQPPYRLHFPGSQAGVAKPTEQYQLVHTVLRAYCVAVIKCCQLAFNLVQSQVYYEEEDMVTFMFGREFLPNLDPHSAMDLLNDAMICVNGLRQADVDLRSALVHRLLIRQTILASLEGDDDQWQVLRAHIGSLSRVDGEFIPIPEAFSTKVQRQLATSTPPRPMADLSWEKACEMWKKLCDDVLAAFSLTSPLVRQDPQCLQRAAWTFAYRSPLPCTFARAKMQEILAGGDQVGKEIPYYDLLFTDIRDLVLAGDPLVDPTALQVEMPSDPRYKASQVLESFMASAIGEYLNVYRITCQNHCRMRRAFTQAVPILDDLLQAAEETDSQLHEILGLDGDRQHCVDPTQTWTRYYKLQMIEWAVQLGFETDIYLSDELGDMYALLELLTGMKRDLLDWQGQNVLLRAEMHSRQNRLTAIEECRVSGNFIRRLSLQARISHALAGALSDIYMILESFGLVRATQRSYLQSQLRYEARMKPFLKLNNCEVPQFEEFEAAKTERKQKTVAQACDFINATVKTARSYLQELKTMTPEEAKYIGTEDNWKHELKQLQTVCVSTSVTASQLLALAEQLGKREHPITKRDDWSQYFHCTISPPGQRYHDWWTVPQLKKTIKKMV